MLLISGSLMTSQVSSKTKCSAFSPRFRPMALSLKMLILDASNDHKSAWFESLILCTIAAQQIWPQGNWSQVRSNKNWTVCTYCTYFRRIISWLLGLYHSMGQVKIIPGQGVKKLELISFDYCVLHYMFFYSSRPRPSLRPRKWPLVIFAMKVGAK